MAGFRRRSACISFTISIRSSLEGKVAGLYFWLAWWSFSVPVGLPQRGGITDEGRTVSTVFPGFSCWQYLLNHVRSETLLKET